MQDIEQLPLDQWANQLKAAREAAQIEFSSLAQELRLSPAQLRGIESGSLSAFHGPGYYLRAVEKCARRLDIVLDPPVTELKLTDSQLALKRVKNTPSASTLAKKQSNILGADAMPSPMRRTRIGLWLGAILIALVATGTWMSIQEGWPNGDPESQADSELATNETEIVEQDAVSTAEADLSNTNNSASTSTNQTQPASDLFGSPLASGQTSEAAPQESTPLPAATETPAVPEPNAPPPPPAPPEPPAPPDVIEASFNDDCWVEIRRVDGTTEQGIYRPGQTVTVEVADIDRLTFGNAAAVNATRAGQSFDVMRFTRGGNNVARIAGDALN